MAQRLVSKADFARLAGRSKPAISKALRGALREALVGDRVDVNHPAAQAYLKACGKSSPPTDHAPTAKQKRRPAVPVAPTEDAESARKRRRAPTGRRRGTPDPPPFISDDEERGGLQELAAGPHADMTFRQAADRWGSFREMSDLLDNLKTMAETDRLELANEEKRGTVISRDLVRQHIFGALDAVFKRLLGDSPRTIQRRLYALAKSGAAPEEGERTVRELISSQLKPIKSTAARVLREPVQPSEHGAKSE